LAPLRMTGGSGTGIALNDWPTRSPVTIRAVLLPQPNAPRSSPTVSPVFEFTKCGCLPIHRPLPSLAQRKPVSRQRDDGVGDRVALRARYSAAETKPISLQL